MACLLHSSDVAGAGRWRPEHFPWNFHGGVAGAVLLATFPPLVSQLRRRIRAAFGASLYYY